MNRGQLMVLWYAGFILSVVCVFIAHCRATRSWRWMQSWYLCALLGVLVSLPSYIVFFRWLWGTWLEAWAVV